MRWQLAIVSGVASLFLGSLFFSCGSPNPGDSVDKDEEIPTESLVTGKTGDEDFELTQAAYRRVSYTNDGDFGADVRIYFREKGTDPCDRSIALAGVPHLNLRVKAEKGTHSLQDRGDASWGLLTYKYLDHGRPKSYTTTKGEVTLSHATGNRLAGSIEAPGGENFQATGVFSAHLCDSQTD